MRLFKLISGLIVVLAFSVVAVATASAAEMLWKWLPGVKGTTFTGSSGKATLRAEGGASIVCQSSKTASGELTEPNPDATLALAVVNFSKCLIGGLEPVLSLAAGKEEIVSHIEIHTCLIKPNDLGLSIKTLPVHIETQTTGLLLLVEGLFVGLTEPLPTDLKHWVLNIKAKAKNFEQEIKLCEGGAELSLTTSIDGGAPLKSSEEALEGLITFATAQDPT